MSLKISSLLLGRLLRWLSPHSSFPSGRKIVIIQEERNIKMQNKKDKKPKYVKTKEGICPVCGKSLNYGDMELEDGQQVYYEVDCVCGFEGKEWYSLVFGEITNNKDSDEEV
jgi:hypothetical protein